jgi:hypothetical protein
MSRIARLISRDVIASAYLGADTANPKAGPSSRPQPPEVVAFAAKLPIDHRRESENTAPLKPLTKNRAPMACFLNRILNYRKASIPILTWSHPSMAESWNTTSGCPPETMAGNIQPNFDGADDLMAATNSPATTSACQTRRPTARDRHMATWSIST